MTATDWDALIAACADEPIHVPGAVQPHGVLVVVDPASFHVLQVSESSADHLRLTPEELLGRPLDGILDADGGRRLRTPTPGTQQLSAGGRIFDVTTATTDAGLLVEFEPATPRPHVMVDDIVDAFAEGVQALRTAETLIDLAEATAAAVRHLTGYDRIDVYRFHDDWHGEVIAEDRAEHMAAYLGLHFPASDIPAQARELYRRNWFRQIVDARAEASRLVPQRSPRTQAPVDLSEAHLRAVSPVHLEYLRNMGVTASMSISIVDGERLWGLVACHHARPRRLTYEQRSAARSIGELLSLRIPDLARAAAASASKRALSIQAEVVDRVIPSGGHGEVLRSQAEHLRQMCPDAGVAIHVDGQTTTHGPTPSVDELQGLLDWLARRAEDDLVTRELGVLYPPAAQWGEVAAGMIAGRLGGVRDQLLFFRPEEAATVTWAGAPEKRVDGSGSQARLAPRRSFAAWVEERGGRSAPWHPWEVEAALGVAAALRAILLNRDEVLRLGETRFRAAVETLSDAFTIYEALHAPDGAIEDFLVTFVNEAGFTNGVVPRVEVVGARLRDLPAHLWDDGLFEAYVKTVETGRPLVREVVVGSEDDPVAVFDVRASRIDGGLASTWRDVTERRRTELAIRLASRQARAASAAKNDVLSRVSHELRTPLNAIIGFAELQTLPDADAEERRENAEMVLSAARLLLHTVDEILDLSALEAGRIALKPTSVDIGRVVEGAVELLRMSAEQAQVRCVAETPPGELRIVTDPTRLRQIVLNLATNAIKFNEPGGHVTLTAHDAGDGVEVTVRDDGPGIPRERIDDVFEPFERLDAGRRGIAGTGLGLALVRRLVDELGGTLDLRSQPGSGTVVSFWLPADGNASRKTEPPDGPSTTSA